MLLPHFEVNAGLGIVLLPTELRIESVGAVRETDNALVHVNHLLLLLARPVDVDAQRRSAAEGSMVLVKVQHWEVVLRLLHKEVVVSNVDFGAEVGLLSVFFVCPAHDLQARLIVLRGHDAQAELNLGKVVCDLGPVAIDFANDRDLLLGDVQRQCIRVIIFTDRRVRCARTIVNSLVSVRS